MSYEHICLEAKTVAGLSARTSNRDPGMGEIIGGLWRALFQLPPVSGRIGGNAYGVYSGYENGTQGFYNVTAAVRVSAGAALPENFTVLELPAGPYALFTAPGGPEAAAGLWQEIWSTPLDRAFTCDFEEYPADESGIRIYIALRA